MKSIKITLVLLVLCTCSTFSQNEPATVVSMTNTRFQPDQITVKAGETILWENPSDVAHTVTFDPTKAQDESHAQVPEGVDYFGSGKMNPGDTFKHTFRVPGTYKYFCIPHESAGMLGRVIVEESGTGETGHSHEHETDTGAVQQADNQGKGETSRPEEDHAEGYDTYKKGIGIAAKFSEYPNLHPMVIHFPIVLLMLAAAGQILALFLRKKSMDWFVLVLIFGGFAGGMLAAYLFHAEVAVEAPVEIRRIFEEHKQFASITLWLSGAALGLKIISMLLQSRKWIEILVMLVLLVSAGSVGYTGHLGSQMVFLENVGPKGQHLSEEHSH